ncbi:hypothetical protein, partial [Pseudomonas aeruginosa]|uniref:DprA-like winged helix domain-containing protein n=1 Tax=Pseudomonas aeruginosa TaxID=287 RepID=UPI001C7D6FEF
GLLADPHYEGNHQLIKQGANLASSPDDLIEYISSSLKWVSIDNEINYESPKIENIQLENKAFNSGQQFAIDKILPFLRFNEVIPIDIIANNSGLSTSQLAPLLLELELIEKIAIVAGGYTRLE